MKTSSGLRRAAWYISHRWTALKLLAQSRFRKRTEWEPLVTAPAQIGLVDGNAVERVNDTDQIGDWEEADKPVRLRLHAIRTWFAQQLNRAQPREHEANALPVDYFLAFVRLYAK
ncbi:MAG: hypothetical protein ACP5P4_06325 [Steroidobacteraceae bacterium]